MTPDENDLTGDEVRAMWDEGEPVDVYSYYDDDQNVEVAEYHQAHKDDPDEWTDEVPAPKRRSEKRRLSSMVSVRFTPAEADELRRIATAMGMSLSGYLRWLATRSQPLNLTNTGNNTTVTIAGPYLLRYPEAS